MKIIWIAWIYSISAFLWNPPKYLVDVKKSISIDLPKSDRSVLNKINGFFGVIGPDLHYRNITNLFDLFIRDGNIQGVFFKEGNLTFVRHYVRTEKYIFERDHGEIPDNPLVQFALVILRKMGFPNWCGVANTALLQVEDRLYALYERDAPYEIGVDFANASLTTIGKVSASMPYFSAHSKWRKLTNTIETVNYDVVSHTISYDQLDSQFYPLRPTHIIRPKYMPMVHDFGYTSSNRILLVDAPFAFNLDTLGKTAMPLHLDPRKTTAFLAVDKTSDRVDVFPTNQSFFIFHYVNCSEDAERIYLWASIYTELDFSQFQLSGKYRKIVLNKATKEVTMESNPKLDQWSLEFPNAYDGDKIVFSTNRGFVVCRGLELVKRVEWDGHYTCGEPAIEYIDGVPYLIVLTFSSSEHGVSNLVVVHLRTYHIIKIPLNESLNVGFHSLFLPRIYDNEKERI
jgi:carotenoid cleavage dioxygenase-like enzyme